MCPRGRPRGLGRSRGLQLWFKSYSEKIILKISRNDQRFKYKYLCFKYWWMRLWQDLEWPSDIKRRTHKAVCKAASIRGVCVLDIYGCRSQQ